MTSELDGDAWDTLDARLAEDDDALAFYVAYMRMHAQLGWARRSDEVQSEQPVGHAPRDEQPQTAERARMKVKGGSLGELDSARGACPTPRSKSWLDRASRHPKVPAIAIAVAVMVMLVGAMAVTPVSKWIAGNGKDNEERQPAGPTPSEFVAILNSSQDATWLDDTQPRLSDPRLEIGRRLAIASGLIEVKYSTGVMVVIEGPAEFWVGGTEAQRQKAQSKEKTARSSTPKSSLLNPKSSLANSGYLKLGNLVARVEGEKAQGFFVDTPFARVEDHGTEFGVEVRKSGAADVVVLDGKVELVCEAIGDVPERRIPLTKNQGASVATKGGDIVRRATVDASVIYAMRRRLLATVRQEVKVLPPPTIVSVSSVFLQPNEEDRFQPENLFDDRLNGAGSDYAGLGAGPHTLVLDLGRVFEVRGVRFAHRQDAGDWRIDRVHKLELEFAESDAFEDASQATVTPELETLGVQTHSLAALRGRFVRVTFHGDSEQKSNVGASTLEFLGSPIPPESESAESTITPETTTHEQSNLDEDNSSETE